MSIEFFATTETEEYVANMSDAEWFDLMVDCFANEMAEIAAEELGM